MDVEYYFKQNKVCTWGLPKGQSLILQWLPKVIILIMKNLSVIMAM